MFDIEVHEAIGPVFHRFSGHINLARQKSSSLKLKQHLECSAANRF